MEQFFVEVDEDEDGFITRHDINTYATTGEYLCPELNTLFEEVDTDESRRFSVTELRTWWQSKCEVSSEAEQWAFLCTVSKHVY